MSAAPPRASSHEPSRDSFIHSLTHTYCQRSTRHLFSLLCHPCDSSSLSTLLLGLVSAVMSYSSCLALLLAADAADEADLLALEASTDARDETLLALLLATELALDADLDASLLRLL